MSQTVHAALPEPAPARRAQDAIAVCHAIPGRAQPARDAYGQRCVYLTPEQRRQLWAGIQQHNPGLASLLQSAEIQLIRELFGGFDLLLSPEDLRLYMSTPE